MIELIESSEIDFWNFYLYCGLNGSEGRLRNLHGPRPVSNDYSSKEILHQYEVDFFLENFHSMKIKNDTKNQDTLTGNQVIDYNSTTFLRKVKALSQSPTNELIALKILAKISAVKSIDSQNLFRLFGFSEWIEEMCLRENVKIFLEAWKIAHNLDSNSNVVFMDGVFSIYPPMSQDHHQKTTPVVDIVLVHGIMGGAAWTWRQNDSKRKNNIIPQKERMSLYENICTNSELLQDSYSCIWPLDWFKLRLKIPLRLIAIDYPAFWWKWSGECASNDKNLNALSEEFLYKLKKAGIGSRPIIWIAHSMGGLIVKKMLELEDEHINIGLKTNSQQNILSSTSGIVFLSVPHFGSQLSSWSCLFPSILKPCAYICDMNADAPELRSLHNKFLNYCQKYSIEVLTLIEGKPSKVARYGPKFKFVTSKNGDPGIGEFHEVDATHLGVCKPHDILRHLKQEKKELRIFSDRFLAYHLRSIPIRGNAERNLEFFLRCY